MLCFHKLFLLSSCVIYVIYSHKTNTLHVVDSWTVTLDIKHTVKQFYQKYLFVFCTSSKCFCKINFSCILTEVSGSFWINSSSVVNNFFYICNLGLYSNQSNNVTKISHFVLIGDTTGSLNNLYHRSFHIYCRTSIFTCKWCL